MTTEHLAAELVWDRILACAVTARRLTAMLYSFVCVLGLFVCVCVCVRSLFVFCVFLCVCFCVYLCVFVCVFVCVVLSVVVETIFYTAYFDFSVLYPGNLFPF